MKRIAIIVVMALMTFTASATSIRYFTYSQATRTVKYLNAQNEMMIYCGYDYEIETYVLINEVWMERINSAYYELWVYGYDAYTGDEIYMPLDLQCVWLYSAGRMYNAAQYLRFHSMVHTPAFAWYIPPYNPYSRRMHMAGYVRSYHYDIHRHGWMPPTPPHHGYGPHTHPPLPPYYMRTPQTPPPAPVQTWTPGLEHPQVHNSGSHGGPRSTGAVPSTTRPSASGTTGTPSGTARTGSTTRGTNDNVPSTTRGTGTTTRTEGTTRGEGTARSEGVSRSQGTTTTRSAETTTTERAGNTTTTRSLNTTPTRTNTGAPSRTESSASQENGSTTRSSGTTTRTSGSTTTTTRSGNSRNSGTTTTNTRSTGSTTTRNNSGTTAGGRSTNTRR